MRFTFYKSVFDFRGCCTCRLQPQLAIVLLAVSPIPLQNVLLLNVQFTAVNPVTEAHKARKPNGYTVCHDETWYTESTDYGIVGFHQGKRVYTENIKSPAIKSKVKWPSFWGRSKKKISGDCKKNPKLFWQYINKRNKSKTNVSDLKWQTSQGNEMLAQDDKEKAAAFQDFFHLSIQLKWMMHLKHYQLGLTKILGYITILLLPKMIYQSVIYLI